MNTTTKTLSALAGLALIAGSVDAALVQSSGTLVASFTLGERDNGASGDYTVNSVAGAGVLHTDGLYMTGQVGAWERIIRSGGGNPGPISGTSNGVTFTYAASGEPVQHNSQSSNTDPRHGFWRYGALGAGWADNVTFTISGLNDNSTYDLIFYSGGELTGTTGRNTEVNIGGTTVTPDADGDANFTGVQSTGGVISGTFIVGTFGDSSLGRIAAFQIAEIVPEPGSLALLGLGGLMIARRRRG